MNYSLNEIESMCKRAARGAGMHWGMAEEAAKAVRLLSAYDLPGVPSLASLLEQNDGKSYEDLAPISVGDIWTAASGELCPLCTGAAICDSAATISDGRVIKTGGIKFPLLLIPFVLSAAKMTKTTLLLSWPNVAIKINSDGIQIDGNSDDVCVEQVDAVECARGADAPVTFVAPGFRRDVDTQAWGRLNIFAQRTYAPATAASRLAGAGAGLTDTD